MRQTPFPSARRLSYINKYGATIRYRLALITCLSDRDAGRRYTVWSEF